MLIYKLRIMIIISLVQNNVNSSCVMECHSGFSHYVSFILAIQSLREIGNRDKRMGWMPYFITMVTKYQYNINIS